MHQMLRDSVQQVIQCSKENFTERDPKVALYFLYQSKIIGSWGVGLSIEDISVQPHVQEGCVLFIKYRSAICLVIDDILGPTSSFGATKLSSRC